MKRNTKHLFSLILAVVMMLSMTISGFAAGIVTYKSGDEKFEFKPGTEYSDTDLFTDFKEMMPGDNKSQEIRFVYNGKDGVTANVYLQMKLPASDFKANDKTNNIFIHYWFSFFQAILEAQAPESAQKNINLKILSELKIIVPPIEQQNEFVAFVEQTDKSKFEIQKSLEKLETLKKALMQKYFG